MAEQLQGMYGLQPDGTQLGIEALTHLKADEIELAVELRAWQNHMAAGAPEPSEQSRRAAAFQRMAHEAAFTVLNRLAAIRMAEERGHVIESVRKGSASDGFRLFEQLAAGALGNRDETYLTYLGLLFDELDTEIGVLFERRSPGGRLFPRASALSAVLDSLNSEAVVRLWTEDETIGWIYQYFNSKEERDAMRKASAAPRNSRDLAVRNQFFTPRYVVEFLTDNTLGRLWYEMRSGATRLGEECRYLMRRPNEIFLSAGEAAPQDAESPQDASQAELLHVTDYVHHRPKKDPRELAILDPAAGSGHFLLYAFDLLETIYQESWSDPDQARCSFTGQTLAQDYPDRDGLLKALPGLVLRHNLHGIDIDPRAQQIAVLALWLRAQRSFQQLAMPPAERPPIRRTNIVTAEPMPGERQLLEEFVASLRPAVLGDLVRVVWEKMRIAGEAGSLLKIDEELRTAIAAAKQQWLQGSQTEQLALFGEDARRPEQIDLFDVSGITDAQFWEETEERVLEALRRFAEAAGASSGTTRRLFVDDAIEGFAFIELSRRAFDVVLMNPPFGLMPRAAYEYSVTTYPLSYMDTALAFMNRGIDWLAASGRVGAITSRAFMTRSDADRFRSAIALKQIDVLADLGTGVMDSALVDASAQVLASRAHPVSLFLDCRRQKAKGEKLLRWVQGHGDGPGAYAVILKRFARVEGARIAYDLAPGLEVLLAGNGSGIDPTLAIARKGGTTFEDERFLRLRWEVDPRNVGADQTWVLVGRNVPDFAPYYYPNDVVLKWSREGKELQARNEQVNGQTAQARQGSSHYFKPGMVFGTRSSPTIAFRVQPAGCSISATAGFVLPHKEMDRLLLLGYLNSTQVRGVLSTLTTMRSYTVGHIRALRPPDDTSRQQIGDLALQCLTAKRLIFRMVETDPHFVPMAPKRTRSLLNELTDERGRLQALGDSAVQAAIGIDRLVAGIDAPGFDESLEINGARPHDIGRAGPSTQIDSAGIASALVSFAVGAAFGRWDARLALDDSLWPSLPDPFDALPSCSPGTLQGPDGFPATPGRIVSEAWLRARPDGKRIPAPGTVDQPLVVADSYPLHLNWDGILVDDPGLDGDAHRDDLVSRVREVLALLWPSQDGTEAQAIEAEACQFLGVRSLEDYLRRPTGFFADHLSRYSTSRRQAPIYWPLSTASGSYTIWAYCQRLSDDFLYRAVTKYVEPKLAEVVRRMSDIETELTGSSGRDSSRLRDRFDQLRVFRSELDELRSDLLRVAALPYRPNLDDGVLISAAPLHWLFRLPKWRKDLEACWSKLEAGGCDWSHLARAIWPERVRESCKVDRSIAIAQGLESLYQGPEHDEPSRNQMVEGEDEEVEADE